MSNLISFKKFQAIPLSKTPAKVLIRWEMNCPENALVRCEFFIERAEAPDERAGFQHVDMMYRRPVTPEFNYEMSKNLQVISQSIEGVALHEYVDYSPDLLNLSKPLYYRIKCRNIETLEIVETPFFSFGGDLDMVGLYVVDEHNYLLEDTIGAPCLVYARRRNGIRCENCYDAIQKKVTRSNCSECFGTTWKGGYYKPIDSYIDFSPNPKQMQMTEWGEMQPNQSNILMSNYPSINENDLIIELQELRYWRVEKITETEKRRIPMLQFGIVEEINPGDIEYSVKPDEDFIRRKLEEFEWTKRKREF